MTETVTARSICQLRDPHRWSPPEAAAFFGKGWDQWENEWLTVRVDGPEKSNQTCASHQNGPNLKS